jgi:acid phosphatase family membrane protein YuiD
MGSTATEIARAATAANATMVKSQYEAVTNLPLVAAFVAFAVAQSLKVLTTWYKEKRWDVKRLYGSGGMPSSHSATVMGLACAIGLREGPASPLFAIALVLASIVMYDASGVRLQAGRQAEVITTSLCLFFLLID